MPRGAIGDWTAIERFRHENEIPLMTARDVHDVLPALRRQALAEIGAQGIDSF